MNIHFDNKFHCLDFLIANFYTCDFAEKYTRKELAYMLSLLEPQAYKTSDTPFCSMCKKRMCTHIDFYLKVHTADRLRMRKFVRGTFCF